MSEESIAIIGAGVIGASVALALQQDHHRVILFDREKPGAGASFGNAGVVVNGSCIPTAMPGIAFSGLKMMFGRKAPFSISPGYFHRATPWLIRFILQSSRTKAEKNARNLHALTANAADEWRKLTNGTDLAPLLKANGWLKVYETEQTFAATAYARLLMDEIGTEYQLLTATDIQDIEPQLAPIFERGILQEDSLNITNPERMVQGMVDLFVSRGGCYEQFEVEQIRTNVDSVALAGSGKNRTFKKVVIAAGARSRLLTNQLNEKIPLDSERGYHCMLGAGDQLLLKRTVMNGDAGFVLAPMETGLRISSQVELAGIDAPPDYRYIRQLLPLVRRMLPGINTNEESVWMGCRPSLPDSLPVIGQASGSDRVIYAFGHQHLGMTLGPVSGQLAADLVAGRNPNIDILPYRTDRF